MSDRYLQLKGSPSRVGTNRAGSAVIAKHRFSEPGCTKQLRTADKEAGLDERFGMLVFFLALFDFQADLVGDQ